MDTFGLHCCCEDCPGTAGPPAWVDRGDECDETESLLDEGLAGRRAGLDILSMLPNRLYQDINIGQAEKRSLYGRKSCANEPPHL